MSNYENRKQHIVSQMLVFNESGSTDPILEDLRAKEILAIIAQQVTDALNKFPNHGDAELQQYLLDQGLVAK